VFITAGPSTKGSQNDVFLSFSGGTRDILFQSRSESSLKKSWKKPLSPFMSDRERLKKLGPNFLGPNFFKSFRSDDDSHKGDVAQIYDIVIYIVQRRRCLYLHQYHFFSKQLPVFTCKIQLITFVCTCILLQIYNCWYTCLSSVFLPICTSNMTQGLIRVIIFCGL
jgi:hypothetical protein